MLRVVFCGTPDIAVTSLEAIAKHSNISIDYVISQPDRPAGRGQKLKSPEVVDKARELGLEVFQTENLNREEEFLTKLESNPPDLFIVFAFAQFLGKRVLNLSKLGCFNIHTSLLPRHRGAAPIHYGIWCGDKIGGVSIQRMVKKMDAGDICHSIETPIGERETTPELYARLKDLAAVAANEFLTKALHNVLSFNAQDESLVTFAPTIKKEDGLIDVTSLNAVEVDRRVRAFKPWPGVQVLFGSKRCKLDEVIPTNMKIAAGHLKKDGGKLYLGCLDSSVEIIRLQLEGKPAVEASAWLNGQQGDLPLVSSLGEKNE